MISNIKYSKYSEVKDSIENNDDKLLDLLSNLLWSDETWGW
jgi:hypothetical protein